MLPLKLNEDWLLGKKKGLCSGELSKYIPWISIRSFHSYTPRHRVFNAKLNRIIHLMSQGELMYFHLFDWDDRIRDIKEQYALDPMVTYQIADRLKIKHPGYTSGGQVMTSDFLLTFINNDGSEQKMAVQVKESDNLDKRTLEKIELERVYWESKGITFKLCFSSEINRIFAQNLQHLYMHRQKSVREEDLDVLYKILTQVIRDVPEASFSFISDEIQLPVPSGVSYSLTEAIKLLCAKKLLKFPVETRLLKDCDLKDFVEA